MGRLSSLAHLLLGGVFLMTGCMKLDLFRRSESHAAPVQGCCVGMLAPEIEGEDFEGNPFKLSDYRGKVVVLSFWTSW